MSKKCAICGLPLDSGLVVHPECAPQWIPVSEKLPENAKRPGGFCPKYRVYTIYGETYGWYNPDRQCWYALFWFMTERYLEHEIDFEHGDVPAVVRCNDPCVVTHWMPKTKPPKEVLR